MDVDGIEISTSAGGLLLSVKAMAGSRQNAIRGVIAGRLKVSIASPAEKGQANRAIVDLLAQALRLPRRQIAIVCGFSSPLKQIEIRGLSIDQLKSRLVHAAG